MLMLSAISFRPVLLLRLRLHRFLCALYHSFLSCCYVGFVAWLMLVSNCIMTGSVAITAVNYSRSADASSSAI